MLSPEAGKLGPYIAEVTTELLQEINSRAKGAEPTFEEKIEMLQMSPILGTAADVTVLLAVEQFGEYEHPNEEIQSWVRSNFKNMEGSFKKSVAEQMSAKFLKYAVSEWSIKEHNNEWLLDSIAILHPSFYTFRTLERKLYDIVERSGGSDTYIPIERVILSINGPHVTFGNPVRASSDCKRAATVYKAWKLVMSEMLVAAQRQAVPILIGHTDANERVILYKEDGRTPLLGTDGKPIQISASQDLMNQMLEVDNRAVISTSLQTKIEAINHQTDGKFFAEVLKVLERLQFLSFMFPETIFSVGEGGIGNAGINKGHMDILMLGIDGVADQIREEMLEKPIRNLITWNYGEQETYGSFQRPERETSDRVTLLSAISNAVFQGSFSASDQRVIDRMMDLAGIPKSGQAIGPGNNGNGDLPIRQVTSYWRTA